MDKDFSSIGTQYIICECGDNFPNENFLNIHLANGHGEVDTYLCDVCPEAFPSTKLLLQHKLTHKPETPKKPDLKMQKTPQVKREKTETEIHKEIDKKPPVIKVQSLKKINSISLIQDLRGYGRFIKIEPPDTPAPAVVERVEEPAPVAVKREPEAEAEDSTEEIYYQCDVCNSIFYTEADFNVHYQSEHALKQEPPTAEQILEEHLVTDHSDNAGVQDQVDTVYYYECEACHKIFASEKYFNIHYNKAHDGLLPVEEEEETEEITQQDVASNEDLEAEEPDVSAEDTKSKAPEQVVYYKCDLCKILYPSEKAYNTHFDKKHGGQSCQDIQSTGFRYIEQDLTQEYRPIPAAIATAEVFTCEFCPKSFNIKRSLQVHRKRVHFDKVKGTDGLTESGRAASRSKVCDICGRAYNSNAALRYHQRRHTGEKPYPCTICPKRFTMPMFLQIHMRTHTGEKPYACPHCPKAFTNKAALIRHDRVHTGVKPYPCPECGKYFTQSNSMKLHVSTVHLKLPAPYKSKSRRNKSEARALQLALKGLCTEDSQDTLILGE